MIGYYPGCSLHATGKEYGWSVRLVARALAVDLQEVPGWLCCGASSGPAVGPRLALALAADTLAKARDAGLEQVLAPCAMCYSRLATAAPELPETPPRVKPLSVLDWLHGIPDERLAAPVGRPLVGLKVACYYGCLLGLSQEGSGQMERVLGLLGADPVAWTHAVECCGGACALAEKPAVLRQGRRIAERARRAGAEAVVLACPMCHANLDTRQAEYAPEAAPLPVLYLTQLMGLAYGATDEDLGFRSHFVSPLALLSRVKRSSAGSPPSGQNLGE